MLPIVANTATTFSVAGEYVYTTIQRIVDWRTLSGSTTDAGTNCMALTCESDYVAMDKDGRAHECPPYDGSAPGCPDIGAYEHIP